MIREFRYIFETYFDHLKKRDGEATLTFIEVYFLAFEMPNVEHFKQI